MSLTLEYTEPAEATGSVVRIGTWRTVSRTIPCGTATLGASMMPDTRGSLSVIPNGWKMRVLTNSSHGMPDTFATIAPAMA